MRRVAGTAALFLLLTASLGAILHVGWREYAQRAGVVTLVEELRRSDCWPPHCIRCPRPGRPIHWPREFASRRHAERR
jgi:hypothetical protein